MDLSEFEHIFGAGESAFINWDTDNNGLIDSLEVFSGMCIFSNTKFDDKIRCIFYIYILFIFFITLTNNNNKKKKKVLFDLFDFNELESLSSVDIEFMIYSCLSATYKIFSISTELNIEELAIETEKIFES